MDRRACRATAAIRPSESRGCSKPSSQSWEWPPTGATSYSKVVDKISSFYRWADQQVQRHHGRVMHRAGDAVVASFNVSGMRLDHTLHALQAAIEIRDESMYASLPLGAAIAVGPAVVGQLSEQSDLTVIGETPNLAARLQAQAAAGEILLSEEAFRRVRDWLAEQKLAVEEERLALKGLAQPVTAYRLGSPELAATSIERHR